MDEAAARLWLTDDLGVPRETMERLTEFAAFLASENERQNLVSASSLSDLWTRHIVDSAQLLRYAPAPDASWVDLGTGAGFPGLIIALLHQGPVMLVEQRKMRVDFLRRAADLLEIGSSVEIICARAQAVAPRKFGVISARAFAPLERLLTLGEQFAAPETRWVLPKGRNAKLELEAAESSWQGEFRLEPSLTDAASQIIVAQGVRRRGRDKRSR